MPRDYPLALEVQYQVLGGPPPANVGCARTNWISSKEIILETDRKLPPGTELEMSVFWPAPHERAGLKLWIRGTVVHTRGQGITASIRKHQFRMERRGVAAGASRFVA